MNSDTPENRASLPARSRRRRALNPLEHEEDIAYINELLFEEEDDPQLFQEDLSSDIDENRLESSDSSDSDSESDDETEGNINVTQGNDDRPVSAETQWDWQLPSSTNYVPGAFTFDSRVSGIQQNCPITEESKEIDYFLLFFDEELMQYIVDETNRYYQNKVSDGDVSESTRKVWKDVSVSEMYSFLSLTMSMPLVYKGDVKDYWSTNPLIKTEIFSKVMSRDRYLVLLRMMHFANNAENPGDDRLFRIRYVFEDLVRKFKSYFQPFQNLVIDESLLLFKGRLAFKQYIPSKRHRFGIKIFVMCDCESGMILDMIIYSGRDTDVEIDQHLGLSGSVVKKLMTDYLGKGHTMYTDNFYTSPSLAHFLKENYTGSCGTVRANSVCT